MVFEKHMPQLLYGSLFEYDTDRLSIDKELVESYVRYEEGYRGHSISLLSKQMVPAECRGYEANFPYTGTIKNTPYFREIHDAFKTDIISMRLLKRVATTSYKLHHDLFQKHTLCVDQPIDIVRFQIPVTTNSKVRLCITDFTRYAEVGGKDKRIRFKDIDSFTQSKELRGHSKMYTLDEGILYYFDTSFIHTLINGGSTDRVTLLMDLVKNNWLKGWMNENLHIVGQ